MRVTIIAVGRLKEPYWLDASREYLKRLRPYATVETVEIPDRDVTRDETRALAEEGAAILRALPEAAHVVVLEIGGVQRSSEEFAAWMAARALEGSSHIVFVVGGAAGLARDVVERASERISLGPMTMPHQMARVLLVEQVYRAFRINRGEPYHR